MEGALTRFAVPVAPAQRSLRKSGALPPLQRCPANAASFSVDLKISKGTLAAELGTRQETLSRILARLKKADVLTVAGRKITVADAEGLRKMFEEHLRPKDEE